MRDVSIPYLKWKFWTLALSLTISMGVVEGLARENNMLCDEDFFYSLSEADLVQMINDDAIVNCRMNNIGHTPLYLAVRRYSPSTIQLLLDAGAHVDARVLFGETPLHNVARRSDLPFTQEIIDLLISSGADVNARDRYGSTPLHVAAGFTALEVVQKLLSFGADVSLALEVDDDDTLSHLFGVSGETVLHFAARNHKNPDVVDLIIKFIDVNVIDENGNTPLHVAVRPRLRAMLSNPIPMVQRLIENGADPVLENHFGLTPFEYISTNPLSGYNADSLAGVLLDASVHRLSESQIKRLMSFVDETWDSRNDTYWRLNDNIFVERDDNEYIKGARTSKFKVFEDGICEFDLYFPGEPYNSSVSIHMDGQEETVFQAEVSTILHDSGDVNILASCVNLPNALQFARDFITSDENIQAEFQGYNQKHNIEL